MIDLKDLADSGESGDIRFGMSTSALIGGNEVTTLKIYVTQIYTEPGIDYPFSHVFQGRMEEILSGLVQVSEDFARRYGSDYKVGFNLGAKKNILAPEIRGPGVYKRTKDVEYKILLPHDGRDANELDDYAGPIRDLLAGVVDVLERLKLDATAVKSKSDAIVKEFSSNPTMFERRRRI